MLSSLDREYNKVLQGINKQAMEQRTLVQKQADEARATLSKQKSDIEAQRQARKSELRAAQRLESRKRDAAYKEPKEQLAEIDRIAEEAFSGIKTAMRDIDTQERTTLGKIRASSFGAIKELNKARLEAKLKVETELEVEESVTLPSGELVPKAKYEELDENAKNYLNKYGLKQYNELYVPAQNWAAETFPKYFQELESGDWIRKSEYAKMDENAKDYINKYGLEQYNELYVVAQNWLVDTIKEKSVHLDTDEWVDKVEYDALSLKEQTYLNKHGVDEFDKWREQSVEIETDKGKVTMPQSEWEAFSKPKQLETFLGRQPSIKEYEDYILQEKGITTGWWQKMLFPTGTLDAPETQIARRWAREEWYATYAATSAERLAAVGIWTAETGVPFPAPGAKALLPGIEKKDVTTPEWVQTGIAPAAYAFPFTGGGVPLYVASGVLTAGTSYLTAESWKRSTTMERIMGIGGIALAASPLLFKVGGLTKSQLDLYTVGTRKPLVRFRSPYVRGRTTLVQKAAFQLEKGMTEAPHVPETIWVPKHVPGKIRTPVTIKWGRGLQRAGLSAEIEKLAFNARAAAKDLKSAQTAASPFRFPDLKGTSAWLKAQSNLKLAQMRALSADTKFLEGLRRLRLNPKQIKLLERVTGYKKLGSLMRNVASATKAVKKAWAAVDKTKIGTPAHLKALSNLEKAKTELNIAANKLDDALQPRYIESTHAGWAWLIDDAAHDLMKAKWAHSSAQMTARELVPSKAKQLMEIAKEELAAAERRLDLMIKARDAGLHPPDISGYTPFWESGMGITGFEGPRLTPTEMAAAKYEPPPPETLKWAKGKVAEEAAKPKPYELPLDWEPTPFKTWTEPDPARLVPRSEAAVTKPITVTPRETSVKVAIAEPVTGGMARTSLALSETAPLLKVEPSYQLTLIPQYGKIPEVFPSTAHPMLLDMPTLAEGFIPLTVPFSVATPIAIPKITISAAEEAITELNITKGQLAGTEALTEEQIKLITKTTSLTQTQVLNMAQTGTLASILTRIETKGLTQLEPIAATDTVTELQTKTIAKVTPLTSTKAKPESKLYPPAPPIILQLPGDEAKKKEKRGTIIVKAKYNDEDWQGEVKFTIIGEQKMSGRSVPAQFSDVKASEYILKYESGRPAPQATLKGILPKAQRLEEGKTITFTILFTTRKVPTAKMQMRKDESPIGVKRFEPGVTSGQLSYRHQGRGFTGILSPEERYKDLKNHYKREKAEYRDERRRYLGGYA